MMHSIVIKAAIVLGYIAGSHAQGTKPPDEIAPGYESSPSVYPAPNTTGSGGWSAALGQAQAFLAQLNLTEKAYPVTGVDGPCVGSIAPIPRLGFGGLCLQDGPAAIRVADYASVFPAGITTAASWDKALIYQRGVAMGQEFKDKGANIILAPVAGPLGRNSLGGRNWEGFSPDPHLTGIASSMTVQDMQSTGAQACGKHYIGNEQETQRNPDVNDEGEEILAISSNIDDRTLHELYLPPFADAVKTGMASVMCSYNRLNQTYACENSKILNGVLKGELGFQGYVVSDWGATHSGLPSILAGLDMDMPGSIGWFGTNSYFGMNLTMAVQNGTLPETRLDDMVLRVITPYLFLQQNSGYPTIDQSSADLNNYDPATSNYTWSFSGMSHRDVRGGKAQLIRRLGADATVLLKNNGSLPLSSPKVIAVFGNDAADLATGLYNSANLDYVASPGFDIGTLAVGSGSGQGRLTYVVPPLEAIKARGRQDGALVQYIMENEVAVTNYYNIYPQPEADWNSTSLVNTVASFCNNTIVVTHSGGINTMPWADNPNVTAILAAHFPGQETGNSIVDVLYGDANPTGRLPYTIALNESDYNTQIINATMANDTNPNLFQENFSEGLMIDYRHFDSANITPRYEFGYGLSYTNFTISSVFSIEGSSGLSQYPEPAATEPGGNPNLFANVATATTSVSNTGAIAGATVLQLYVSLPQDTTPAGTPVKTLHGLEKVYLQPGESRDVSFALTRRDVSSWDVTVQDWAIPSGETTVMVGFSSRDLPVSASMTLR